MDAKWPPRARLDKPEPPPTAKSPNWASSGQLGRLDQHCPAQILNSDFIATGATPTYFLKNAMMEYLKSVYDRLPRSFWGDGRSAEQTVLSTKTALSLLCAAGCSMQPSSEVPELPYYGRSPPVYPSREFFLFSFFFLFSRLSSSLFLTH